MKSTTIFIPEGVYSEHIRTMLDEFVRFYQQMQSVGLEQAVTFTAEDFTKSCVYKGDGVIRVTFSDGEQLIFDDHGFYANLGELVHEHCAAQRRHQRATELCEALETSAPQYVELDKRTMSTFQRLWQQRNPNRHLVLFGRNDDTSDGFTGYIDWER